MKSRKDEFEGQRGNLTSRALDASVGLWWSRLRGGIVLVGLDVPE
jgi:hypothetical protein